MLSAHPIRADIIIITGHSTPEAALCCYIWRPPYYSTLSVIFLPVRVMSVSQYI